MEERRGNTATSAECPKEGWGAKILAGAIGLVCGVLGGVLATAVSPAGESLRELWSPTVALVSGSVVKNGAGIEARVQLDGLEGPAPLVVDDTDDWGGFGFADVSRGAHALAILEDGDAIAYQREFTIGVGERAKELGVMDIAAAQPRLRPDAAPTAEPAATSGVPALAVEETVIAVTPAATQPIDPATDFPSDWIEGTVLASLIEPTYAAPPDPAGTPEAGAAEPVYELVVAWEPLPSATDLGTLPPDARRVSLHLTGADDNLADVERVTYELPESFNPNIVTRYDAADGFRLTFDSGPTTVSTVVYLADGSSIARIIPVEFP